MSERTPTSAEVIERAIRAQLLDVRVSLVAKVVAFDPSKCTVDVQPIQRKPFRNADGDLDSEPFPIIHGVPVVFPGAGGFRVTFPIAVGDLCDLLFADFALDAVKASGSDADPGFVRVHALKDAKAYFGIRPTSAAWTGVSTAAMTAGRDGGPQIYLKASEIALGAESPIDAVALAQQVINRLNELKTVLNSWTPVPGDGGLALKTLLTTLFATWPQPVGSSTVKCS